MYFCTWGQHWHQHNWFHCENCSEIQEHAPPEPDGTVFECQRWSVEMFKIQIVHQGSVEEYVVANFKNHSIPSFGSTHLLRGSRQRDILPNEIVKKMLQRMLQGLWYKWTLLRILQLKWIALVSHQFTGRTIRLPFALHVFGSMGVHIQLWLFRTAYSMASMLRMSSSKTILQHLDSTVHQFQEVVIFSDGATSTSQFKVGLLLSSITQLGRNAWLLCHQSLQRSCGCYWRNNEKAGFPWSDVR